MICYIASRFDRPDPATDERLHCSPEHTLRRLRARIGDATIEDITQDVVRQIAALRGLQAIVVGAADVVR